MTERNKRMSLFMDVHNIEGGVSAADAAGAHEADLATQGEYGVGYATSAAGTAIRMPAPGSRRCGPWRHGRG